MPIQVDENKCCWAANKCEGKSCAGEQVSCASVCPVDVFERVDTLKTDKEKCIDCGVCITVCPTEALILE